MYKGYLIDLDGTMYRGKERIPGAKEFIQALIKQRLPYLFITNNSSATRCEVANKLNQMEIQAKETQIITSAVAAANYIQNQKRAARVFMIGERGLEEALMDQGFIITDTDVDYVIIGIDRQISYEKLATASLLIQQGAKFISTNKDKAIPTERGLLPGNGSLTAVLTICTGVNPIFIGKPEIHIMNEAINLIGLSPNELMMVGDNYETDIKAGLNANMDTLMVLTGYSVLKDIIDKEQQPTYIVSNLMEWIKRGKL